MKRYALTLIAVTLFLITTGFLDQGYGSPIQDGGAGIKATLTVGKTVESKLGGTVRDVYLVDVEKGQYAALQLEQKGNDFLITVYRPDGTIYYEANINGNTFIDFEYAYFIAETSGSYRIEVSVNDRSVPAGGYTICLETLRQATDNDLASADAHLNLVEGLKLTFVLTKDSLSKASEKLNKALANWQKLNETKFVIESLRNLSFCYRKLGENDKALDCLNQALSLSRSSADPRREALTLRSFGNHYKDKGDLEKSLDAHKQAHAIFRKLGDRYSEAEQLNRVADIYEVLGKIQEALENYQASLSLARVNGAKGHQAVLLNNLGKIYSLTGEQKRALEYLMLALPIRREVGDIKGELTTLLNIVSIQSELGEHIKAIENIGQILTITTSHPNKQIEAIAYNLRGHCYVRLAEYQKAHDDYFLSIKLRREVNDKAGESNTIGNIGILYQELGDKRKALKYYEQALSLARETKNKRFEGHNLFRIGNIYKDLGDSNKALENYFQALEIQKTLGARREQGFILSNIGSAYKLIGNIDKALEFYNEALALSRSIAELYLEITLLIDIAEVNYEAGQMVKALELLNKALELNQQKFPNLEAVASSGIARIERDQGSLEQANAKTEKIIRQTESLRGYVLAQDLRTSYATSLHKFYELAIDIAMRLHQREPGKGHLTRALSLAEQLRSRSLIELLAESKTNITQDVDSKLVEKERSLKSAISTKYENLTRLLKSKITPEQKMALEKEVEELLTEYYFVQAQIRKQSPRYASITQVQPFDVKAFQDTILDQNTLLLEFSLGKERSFLWVVARDAITSYELPKQAEIEKAALNLYEIITARSRRVRFELAEKRERRIAEADAGFAAAAAALSNMILAPAARQLTNKRLLIVADGALHYVPFAALPSPEQGKASKAYHPLIVDHEVLNLPSAATLLLLRGEIAARKPAANDVIVFADPVFNAKDDRAGKNNSNKPATNEVSLRYIEQFDFERSGEFDALLPRLINTRREAEAIAQLADKKSKILLGFDASLSAALSPELANYRIVHFGTHGILNSEQPQLSSIVLSLVNEKGENQPGFLTASQVYNMNLSADLAVLSACSTGLGVEIKGEGLVGLTRGFLYAGAARVLVSLWNVNDESTTELMTRFYQRMLSGKRLSPSAALREAQISMLREQKWQAPYYWAAFQLHGEIDTK